MQNEANRGGRVRPFKERAGSEEAGKVIDLWGARHQRDAAILGLMSAKGAA